MGSRHCDYGSNIFLGDNVFMNFGCVILDCNVVRIGADVQCGPGVQIYTAYHPTDPAARLASPEFSAPVTIGDNVRIGANTTIGAGSVVTRYIPANVVAAGNPCRVIRTLE
jgi:maltose O-acetyltransferase